MRRSRAFRLIIPWVGLLALSATDAAGRLGERALESAAALFGAGLLSEGPEFMAQKGLHVALFLMLGLLFARAWPAAPIKGRRPLIGAAILLLLCGFPEVLQRLFPTREPTLLDFVLNSASGFAGALLGSLLPGRRLRPSADKKSEGIDCVCTGGEACPESS